jgi:methyltransferase (TIGR00027 family)
MTAQMTAYCRWHHERYDRPLIFGDRLAGEILGDEGRCMVETLLLGSMARFNPVAAAAFPNREAALAWLMQSAASSSIVLPRARYAEDALERAIAAGVRQYVILGAGLDTFAFRRLDLLERVTVFEVDHPASQAAKRGRIAELGWHCPANLHFVAMDFTCDSLAGALMRVPFDPSQRTFCSWLGVSYYLDDATVRATLRQIAQVVPPGSELVFDYLDLAAFRQNTAAPRVIRMLASVRELGEPMVSGFDALTLTLTLAECGFDVLENLGPLDIQRCFFLGRIDHHRACEHVHFARIAFSAR